MGKNWCSVAPDATGRDGGDKAEVKAWLVA
jgi:hypothetical protein